MAVGSPITTRPGSRLAWRMWKRLHWRSWQWKQSRKSRPRRSNHGTPTFRADVPRPSPVGYRTAPTVSSSWPKRARFVAAFSTWAAAPARTSFTSRPEATNAGASTSCRLPSSGPRPKPPSGESTPISLSGMPWNLQARQAVRHGDRLRPVPHLQRRRTAGFCEESSRSPWAWRDGCIFSASRTKSREPRGPRRISQQEIRDAFHDGWKVKQIEPTRFESIPRPDGPKFSPGGPKAWLATIERT